MYMTNQEVDMPDMPDMLDVDLGADSDEITLDENMEVTVDPETGDIIVEATSISIDTAAFGDNLAEVLDEDILEEIGAKVVEMVERDKESREQWYATLKNGLQALGVYDADDAGEAGLRKVTHPMLLEAATQFQARAMAELLPPGGPVKPSTLGQETAEIIEQGGRIADYMNYQLTIEDRTYYDERDQMLFLLAFTGSEFDKQYYDATTAKVVSRWVRCDHFIVPYDAKNLETAPRYTHELHLAHNAYRRLVMAGVYTDACMEATPEGKRAPLTEELNTLDGQSEPLTADDDKEHVFYETHVDYDIPGLEDDIALPYICTVDSETGKVVGLYRNWKETDEFKHKRVWFTHKKFLPGFGFYGFGMLHCIGNLGEAATEILRILLDAGAFATLQGGFKSKDAKLKGDVELEPGVWVDTEMTAEELSKAFYTPPFKEPSQVLASVLGMLVTAGQKFAATTETMTGDAATTGPVGTMVAQIEQGSKVFSGIHKRLHKSFGDEFIHIADLNGENLPDVYPFRMRGKELAVLRTDFDGRIDVIPVSDPHIFSSAQRLAMAQTALQLAQAMPDIADRRQAAVGLLEAMRFPNAEKLFPKRIDAPRTDPISEGLFVIMGRPIKAFLDQNHQAHIAVHQGQLQSMNPKQQPPLVAHLMEHIAMGQYMQFAQMGVQLPPIEFYPETGEPMYPDVPAEIETQIALQAAQAMQQLMQQQQQAQQAQQAQAPQGENPQQKEAQAQAAFQSEQQRKDAAFQAEEQRKNLAVQGEQQRKNQMTAGEADRQDALAGISPQMIKQAEMFIAETGVSMSARELAVMSKTLGKPFNAVVAAVSRLMLQDQGGSQFPQTAEFVNKDPRFM